MSMPGHYQGPPRSMYKSLFQEILSIPNSSYVQNKSKRRVILQEPLLAELAPR